MKNELPIWYEPHPVTAERKAEIREAGYRILDAVFAPPDYEAPDAGPADPEGAKKATVAELREALTAKGVAIPEGAKKADLQALLGAS